MGYLERYPRSGVNSWLKGRKCHAQVTRKVFTYSNPAKVYNYAICHLYSVQSRFRCLSKKLILIRRLEYDHLLFCADSKIAIDVPRLHEPGIKHKIH